MGSTAAAADIVPQDSGSSAGVVAHSSHPTSLAHRQEGSRTEALGKCTVELGWSGRALAEEHNQLAEGRHSMAAVLEEERMPGVAALASVVVGKDLPEEERQQQGQRRQRRQQPSSSLMQT